MGRNTTERFDPLDANTQAIARQDDAARPIANQSDPPEVNWAEIDLDSLASNFKLMKQLVGPEIAIMLAVKADAYGHGAVACAQALEPVGVDWFGVARTEEGIKLRGGGITNSILCLGGFWEGQEPSGIDWNLTPVVYREDLLSRLDRAALSAGRVVAYHLKIDTGMCRLGLPYDQIESVLERSGRHQNVRLDGLMTHLAAADDPAQEDFTNHQMARFENAVEAARSRGYNPTWIHQSNSAAAHAYPRAPGNMVRIGGAIYGIWRDTTNRMLPPIGLSPVMSLHSRIALLKDVPGNTRLGYGCTFVTSRQSRIATLPLGYADGVRRLLSNRGQVIVRGQLAPIVGRISMDLMMIDVTDVSGVTPGDEVVLIGRQGDASVAVEEIAAEIGTISYEITCGIGTRVTRRYVSRT